MTERVPSGDRSGPIPSTAASDQDQTRKGDRHGQGRGGRDSQEDHAEEATYRIETDKIRARSFAAAVRCSAVPAVNTQGRVGGEREARGGRVARSEAKREGTPWENVVRPMAHRRRCASCCRGRVISEVLPPTVPTRAGPPGPERAPSPGLAAGTHLTDVAPRWCARRSHRGYMALALGGAAGTSGTGAG